MIMMIRADRPASSPAKKSRLRYLNPPLPYIHWHKALTPDEAPIMIRTSNAARMQAFA